MSIPTSDAAHAAWNRLYSVRKLKLERHDSEPFRTYRFLGKGGFSEVYSTDLGNGALVALKRVNFQRRERSSYLNELNILEKLSGTRHRHVIELIGCYELPLRGNMSQIGLLVWPVAQNDLGQFLKLLDTLVNITVQPTGQGESPQELESDERDALKDILDLIRPQWRGLLTSQDLQVDLVARVFEDALDRLRIVFGCLAEAIQYLHNDQKIRYKDMKPSQVLLSPDGLWLTDFGWSLDISELSHSRTQNGERISAKYHAPEREIREPCGRPEDIFALGCTCLEIAYRLCRFSNITPLLNPTRQKGWSFQANLDQKETWLGPLDSNQAAVPNSLRRLISQMMSEDPDDRPSINEVVEILRRDVEGEKRYFGSCCSH